MSAGRSVISVTNSRDKGAKRTVDGVAIDGNTVPCAAAGATVQVTATV
jgi:cellobiose phosphorylase